jgi:K319L-like, PKD domain
VEGNTVTLSAAGSADSDGTIASYAWTQTSGTTVTLTNANTVSASFDSPLTDAQLVMTFQVTVTDDDGATASASTTVTIDPSQPPTAQAGGDSDTVENSTTTLDGSGSTDVDGTIAAYAWLQTSGVAVVLTGADTATPSFDASAAVSITPLEFELTVTDNTGDTGTDTITVSIHPNEPPELSVHFPCDGCRFYRGGLAVTGSVTPGADDAYVSGVDSISQLTFNTGGPSVDAVIDPDGEWVASGVQMNIVNGDVFVVINATDQFGESSSEVMTLPYEPTLSSVLMAPHPLLDGSGYFYETDGTRERLFSVAYAFNTFDLIWTDTPQFGPATIGKLVVDAGPNVAYLNERNGDVVAITLSGGSKSIVSSEFTDPSLMAMDSDDSRLVVFDGTELALYVLDPATGVRTLISDNVAAGSGPAFNSPYSMTVDAANDVAYIQDAPGDYVGVDLTTGVRTLLPTGGETIGTNTTLAHDATRDLLVAFSTFDDRVYTISTVNGNRSLHSDGAGNTGFETGNAREIAVNASSSQYVINDFSPNMQSGDTDRLLSVAATSDSRTVRFADTRGSGPRADGPAWLALDASANAAYAAFAQDQGVMRIDTISGQRQIISDGSTGSGDPFVSLRDIAVDAQTGTAYVIDVGALNLVAVDLATGDRLRVSGNGTGTGPAFAVPVALEPDFANNRLYVVNQGDATVLAVDITSGDRSVVSGNGVGAGAAFVTINGLALDSTNDRLLVTETGNGGTIDNKLLAIDLSTGDRSEVAGIDIGSGPFLNDLRDVVLLRDGESAVASGFSQFLEINLNDGVRQTIASTSVGAGENMINSPTLAYDPTKNVFYTWSENHEALYAVEVRTGTRVTVSK